jgi:uroporphyrin-III C-methyltransferase/precorrin-2 dehydrogenase/sirohydrochlorin ferrochelatase
VPGRENGTVTSGFPLLLDLTGRRAVVVGGGQVALRRARALDAAGADVLVVARRLRPEFGELGFAVAERGFAATDLDGAWLAMACTDDPAVNADVAAGAD